MSQTFHFYLLVNFLFIELSDCNFASKVISKIPVVSSLFGTDETSSNFSQDIDPQFPNNARNSEISANSVDLLAGARDASVAPTLPSSGQVTCLICMAGQKMVPKGSNKTTPSSECKAPNLKPGSLPFTFSKEENACCAKHDTCYQTCGSHFLKCEEDFKSCLSKTPDPDSIWISGMTYSVGCPSFQAIQVKNCRCKPDPNYTAPTIDLGFETLPFLVRNNTPPSGSNKIAADKYLFTFILMILINQL
ncbi:uncharacterized protein LOC142337279 isoform X1 [Convolutriloba macropyga]|uniref:uncharacterized protein LOC142337279 isoform X1 n=1 Tax=Convolutriloba macropyga TaxID=536237 RepID=UPI003F525EC1